MGGLLIDLQSKHLSHYQGDREILSVLRPGATGYYFEVKFPAGMTNWLGLSPEFQELHRRSIEAGFKRWDIPWFD
jgi:hypothetical protein